MSATADLRASTRSTHRALCPLTAPDEALVEAQPGQVARRDPVGMGIAVAGLGELISAAAASALRRSSERASLHVALAGGLLAAARRSSWRTPTLAVAALWSALEVGHAPVAEHGRGRPAPRVLRLLRAVGLGCLLRQSARADRWETTFGGRG